MPFLISDGRRRLERKEENMRQINWKKAEGRSEAELREQAGVPFFVFPSIEKTGAVVHGFSTRLGGVSEGIFSSMNFLPYPFLSDSGLKQIFLHSQRLVFLQVLQIWLKRKKVRQ